MVTVENDSHPRIRSQVNPVFLRKSHYPDAGSKTGVVLQLWSYFLNKSPMACFMTWPPTSEMDFVSGISLGQTSTQF